MNLRTSASITPNFNVLLFPYISSADLGWVSVSTMAKNDDDEVPEDEKTLINFIQDQNLTKIEECLRRKPNLVKKKDTNGVLLITYLHILQNCTIINVFINVILSHF